MHLLGHHLPDHKLLRIALTSFYGISYHTALRILARLQIPSQTVVSSLTEPQITALSAYLSSPSTSTPPSPTPLSPPPILEANKTPSSSSLAFQELSVGVSSGKKNKNLVDPLNNLKIETDLKRSLLADIGHHRIVGTYRGRRHAMGLPVRGQNTRTNARTARKMNSINRRHMSSTVQGNEMIHTASAPRPPSKILQLLGRQP